MKQQYKMLETDPKTYEPFLKHEPTFSYCSQRNIVYTLSVHFVGKIRLIRLNGSELCLIPLYNYTLDPSTIQDICGFERLVSVPWLDTKIPVYINSDYNEFCPFLYIFHL